MLFVILAEARKGEWSRHYLLEPRFFGGDLKGVEGREPLLGTLVQEGGVDIPSDAHRSEHFRAEALEGG